MDVTETAVDRFGDGYSCSQAVFSALAEPLGLDEQTAVKIAAGFSGGMGRLGKTCGAATAAVMALGLKHGGRGQAKQHTCELVRQFLAEFQSRHQSLDCRDLIGCDLSTPEGRQKAKANNTHDTVCTDLVRSATQIVQGLLE